MIWKLFTNCWYSVLVNGVSCGYFSFSRGLRQGDPLFPFLCITAFEVFGRDLKKLNEKYPSLRYYSSTACPTVSHLSYADNVKIFCNGGSIFH